MKGNVLNCQRDRKSPLSNTSDVEYLLSLFERLGITLENWGMSRRLSYLLQFMLKILTNFVISVLNAWLFLVINKKITKNWMFLSRLFNTWWKVRYNWSLIFKTYMLPWRLSRVSSTENVVQHIFVSVATVNDNHKCTWVHSGCPKNCITI